MRVNVKQIAKLTNLDLSKKQEENLMNSISAVISYMDEIKNLNVDNITETTRVTEEENIFREDVIELSFSQEEALKNAKKTKNGFFVVKGIFE